jgi:hypothetical protein
MSATSSLIPQGLLDSEQAAKFLGTTANTLGVWRCNRAVRLPFIKLGKAVRYRLSDLEAYLKANTVDGSEAE